MAGIKAFWALLNMFATLRNNIIPPQQTERSNGPLAFVVDNACGFGLSRMYHLIGAEHLHQGIDIFCLLDGAVQRIEREAPSALQAAVMSGLRIEGRSPSNCRDAGRIDSPASRH